MTHPQHILSVFRLDGDGRALPIRLDEARPGGDLEWIHLSLDEPGTAAWLRDHSGLSPVSVEAMLADEPRPRSVAIGDALLLVLRGINMQADEGPDDMVTVRMWVEAGRVITVRRQPLYSLTRIREQLEAGMGPRDLGDFLVMVLEGMNERILSTVVDLEDAADGLEVAMLETSSRQLRSSLGALRRDVIALRRYVAPQRDAIGRLQAERVSWLDDVHRARLREAADRVTRGVEDLDAIRDRAAVTQEELNNRIAESTNNTMYLLSVVAAIFLPLGLLTGLLGINVGGIPGTESPYAFTIVCAGLLALGVGLALYFRSRDML